MPPRAAAPTGGGTPSRWTPPLAPGVADETPPPTAAPTASTNDQAWADYQYWAPRLQGAVGLTNRLFGPLTGVPNGVHNLSSLMAYLTQKYGTGAANYVRAQASAGAAQQAQQSATQQQTAQAQQAISGLAGQAAAGGLGADSGPFAPPAQLTPANLVQAGLAPDLSTAQQVLTTAQGNPQSLATLQLAYTQAMEQQFMGLAGVSTSLTDLPVQVMPQPNLGAVDPGTGLGGLLQMQTTSFAQALASPRSWSSDQITALQSQLVQAGLLSSGKYHPGVYDPATISGYSSLLQSSIQQNKSVPQTQQAMAASASQQGAGLVGPQQIADPATVTTYVTNTFNKATGRNPTAAELAEYTTDYRNFENLAYGQQVAAATAGFGTQQTQVTTYDPQTDIAAEIAGSTPAQLYGFQPYAAAIDRILGKGT